MPRPWAPLPPARWRSPPPLPHCAGEGAGGEGARTAVLSVPALRMRTGFADPGRPDGSGTPDPYRGNGGAATANGTDDRSRSAPPPPSCRGEVCLARISGVGARRAAPARAEWRGDRPPTSSHPVDTPHPRLADARHPLHVLRVGVTRASPSRADRRGNRVRFPARAGRMGHAACPETGTTRLGAGFRAPHCPKQRYT